MFVWKSSPSDYQINKRSVLKCHFSNNMKEQKTITNEEMKKWRKLKNAINCLWFFIYIVNIMYRDLIKIINCNKL
jgi:hypothetical protein